MGAYIYTLRTANITTTDGTRVHFSKYSFKPSSAWGSMNDYTRHCGPSERAFAIRGWGTNDGNYNNLFVECCENKTALVDLSNIAKQYGGQTLGGGTPILASEKNEPRMQYACDVWGKIVPDSIASAMYCVPVYDNGCDTFYCDEDDRKIVGFLVPLKGSGGKSIFRGTVMRFDAPTARSKWEFVPARTDAEVAFLRKGSGSLGGDAVVVAVHTHGRNLCDKMFAVKNKGFLHFIGGAKGGHELALSETDNQRATSHWAGYVRTTDPTAHTLPIDLNTSTSVTTSY